MFTEQFVGVRVGIKNLKGGILKTRNVNRGNADGGFIILLQPIQIIIKNI